VDTRKIDKALEPYEKTLAAQERFRRRLGVKRVAQPTYQRYITGPIERFDRRKNAFMCLDPNNPYGEDLRRRFKKITGHDHWRDNLPYAELAPQDRIGQALSAASWRLCNEYFPEGLPVTPPQGRLDLSDPEWNSRLVKKAGLFFGAEMVKIARLDQRWVYQDIEIDHPYVIVVVVSHARSMNATAPDHLSWLSATDTYSHLKFITTQLADFIRGLGYDAAYRETLGWNPEMLMVPVAIDAGVGEFARNGRVLSPEFGINMRTKPVTTDLPLAVDEPISFGTHEFCVACEHCATYCPIKAIPFGEPTDTPPSIHNNPGFRKWWVRADKCLTFWAMDKKRTVSCGGRCISVCPWNKPRVPFHNLVRFMAIHGPMALKKMLVWGDKVAYHRKKSIKQVDY
jgi:reductive dehalogenase